MTCTCPAQYTSGTGGGKPGEWGREGIQVAEEERLGGGISKRLESRGNMYK